MPAAKKSARKAGRKIGRPTMFTPSVKESICRRLATGESLAAIARTPGMPTVEAVRLCLLRDESFFADYTRARAAQAEHYAAEIIEIADTCKDYNKARLQIDARKWYASKTAPKKFGDKLDVTTEHTGNVTITIGGNV